jgi:hypothetical protein
VALRLLAAIFVTVINLLFFSRIRRLNVVTYQQVNCDSVLVYSERCYPAIFCMFATFYRSFSRSADCLNERQRLSAPVAYYANSNASFRVDLRLDLENVRSVIPKFGSVHVN